MTFLNPIIAWTGLACIAIPILIHILMRRRRRPVAWGAMKFLLEAYQRQRRRINLEQYLLLASRCLLVALLALALGKPLLSTAKANLSRGERTVYIILDNSLTSSASREGGQSALDRSRDASEKLLGTLDGARGDRAALITLGSPADALVLPPSADIASITALVHDLKATDGRADAAGAIAKLRDDLKRAQSAGEEKRVTIAWMSENRAGACDVGSPLASLGLESGKLNIIAQPPATEALDNVSIVALDPLRRVILAPSTGAAKEAPETGVRIVLRRSGPGLASSATSKVVIRAQASPDADPSTRAEAVVSFPPGQAAANAVISIGIPARSTGRRALVTAAIDRDAIEGDNTFRRPLDVRDRLEVALLTPPSPEGTSTVTGYDAGTWLALALTPDSDALLRKRQGSELRVTLIDPARQLGPGDLNEMNAIIIARPDALSRSTWQSVRDAADGGCAVLVFAPAISETHAWTDAFTDVMGLDWTIAREARDLKPPQSLAPSSAGSAGADLLGMVAAELPELIKPVTVSRVLPISANANVEPVLILSDGTPVVVMDSGGATRVDNTAPHLGDTAPSTSPPSPAQSTRGVLLYFAFAPELTWTDLPTKPLMVPLMQELVRQGIGRGAGARAVIAGTTPVLPRGTIELALTGGGTVNIDATGRLSPPVRHAGTYIARGTGSTSLGAVAFNADPGAGDVEVRDGPSVSRWLAGLGAEPVWLDAPGALPTSGSGDGTDHQGDAPPISLPLLVAALGLALLEAIMARFFSHASAQGPGTIPAGRGAEAAGGAPS